MELNTMHNKQDTLKNGYDSLLLSYAAGNLDEAQTLIVDTHLAFSSHARNFVSSCESIGGMLMEHDCTPKAMNENSLKAVLNRLDDTPLNQEKPIETAENTEHALNFKIPPALRPTLNAQKKTKWKTLYPGLRQFNIKLGGKESSAELLQLDPGKKAPSHTHHGMEITLVLAGAFSDETGTYKTGDMIVTDETFEHTPIACKLEGCTCLIVSSHPVKLTGIARLLNPFLKH